MLIISFTPFRSKILSSIPTVFEKISLSWKGKECSSELLKIKKQAVSVHVVTAFCDVIYVLKVERFHVSDTSLRAGI